MLIQSLKMVFVNFIYKQNGLSSLSRDNCFTLRKMDLFFRGKTVFLVKLLTLKPGGAAMGTLR